jgi:hypothetical protein
VFSAELSMLLEIIRGILPVKYGTTRTRILETHPFENQPILGATEPASHDGHLLLIAFPLSPQRRSK